MKFSFRRTSLFYIDFCNTSRYTLSMDKNFDGFHIEWDDNKNEINKRKHGISLESAGWIFSDEARIAQLKADFEKLSQ